MAQIFFVSDTYKSLGRYGVQMKATMKQKKYLMLCQIYSLMIEYFEHDWHVNFGT